MPTVIPELVYVVGLFFAVVGYIVARGLLATYPHSLGFVLQWMGTHLRIRIPLPHIRDIHIDVGKPFREADHAIITALQTWAAGAEIEMGYFLHGIGRLATLTAQAIDHLARETSETFEWLVNRHLPRWVKHAIELAFPLVWLHKIIAHAISRAIPAVRKEIHTVRHEVTHEVTHIVQRIVHIGVAAPPWVIRLPHRVKHVERDLTHLKKRLSKVEKIAAAATFAALLANTLGVPLRCARRGNLAKAARRVCGLDSGLFNTFLLDLTAILSVVSVVEFAKDMRAVEDEALELAGKLIREFPS